MRLINIAGATLNQTPFDWENNCSNIIGAIQTAKQKGADILCLPELCITGYGCEDVFLSDWLSEVAWEKLLEIKPHCADIIVSVGLPIRIDNVTYNGACLIHNTKILGIALKQNLPKDGVHYEPRWFEPWESGNIKTIERKGECIQVGDLLFTINGLKIGFEICEDAWVTNNRPGEQLCKKGVDIILNPSASHFAMGKSVLREELIRDSSEKFSCLYIYTNQLGNEAGRLLYDGDIIIAQKGKIIGLNKRLSMRLYDVLMCRVDLDDFEKTYPLIEENTSSSNEEITCAMTLALYDYLRKSKAKGFVLSLSGGADSSAIAVFVAEMVRRGIAELGHDTFCKVVNLSASPDPKEITNQLLTCAYQSTSNSSVQTREAAHQLAVAIGARFHCWSVEEEVNSYSKKIEVVLNRKLAWETDDIVLQNIQARSRSPIIWMLANVQKCLLLTTSNRSEGDVGYATMDGDTSGSLAPIAGLSKSFILQWLLWAEKELGYAVLKNVNRLKPTAELRPLEKQQTDEADLMPYPILEKIEKLAIGNRKSPKEVYELLIGEFPDLQLKHYLRTFFYRWSINQWKRERIAPSFHLDDLNVDPRSWCRFPILSGNYSEELEKL